MRRIIASLITVVLILSMVGCNKSSKIDESVLDGNWEDILNEANGTSVNFYGWGGDQRTNEWIDKFLTPNLKDKYNITLNRVPMNIDEILNKLLNEKQLKTEGTIDVVWINGENFYTAKTNDLLYGPFTQKLPNFKNYIDSESIEVNYDFGYPVEGYEAPYGKAQMVMIYDEDKTVNMPKDHLELISFIRENPGKFTYPAPPDFTGSAFVRNIIYDIVGYEQFINMEANKETVYKEIKPAIDYLKVIKPYLWKNGETYPATTAQLDNMFADGEVLMSISYNPNYASGKIATGEFKESTKTFVFDKGTIGNTHFLAVPKNSTNKAGALAVINYILSVETQASKYDPENWGDLPVLENDKLSSDEREIFNDIKLGKASLSQSYLLEKRVPEMPARLVPIIEEIWEENIPVKGE